MSEAGVAAGTRVEIIFSCRFLFRRKSCSTVSRATARLAEGSLPGMAAARAQVQRGDGKSIQIVVLGQDALAAGKLPRPRRVERRGAHPGPEKGVWAAGS